MIVDVQMAFLHKGIEKGEEIHMDCPKGMICQEDECLLLEKMTYGLVKRQEHIIRNSWQFCWKKAFIQLTADPCLYVQWDDMGVV
jgi:hypothetical protein